VQPDVDSIEDDAFEELPAATFSAQRSMPHYQSFWILNCGNWCSNSNKIHRIIYIQKEADTATSGARGVAEKYVMPKSRPKGKIEAPGDYDFSASSVRFFFFFFFFFFFCEGARSTERGHNSLSTNTTA
jgi:hypothetical protein